MTRTITVDVRGLPRPQGSMRLHTLPGGGTAARYPAAVYQWRGQVQQAVAQLEAEPFHGPVELHLAFDLPRPSGHFGTGRNAGTIKPSSPTWPIVAPDLDKLVRAVMDSVTDAGLWRDDSQVVAIHATKCYVTTPPGVTITVADIGRLTDEVLPFTPTVT